MGLNLGNEFEEEKINQKINPTNKEIKDEFNN
jgi:hypothetical protein